ncbi:GtrA family protein [Acidiphilium iwatense]|uniref:GtrA family protein n=1 Tax=Acidiphilium iwatense TaxID=768198 RepID=A0ABS9DUM8_9PROT|nr:GtrA family protein [Acidiphilium iwatense]MCF3946429.1 GtrA family protein [Acidiphilium iwatense]
MTNVSEIRQLVSRVMKFGVTGITSTAIYVGLSYTMIKILALEVIVSSIVAFIIASVFSYLVNTLWSFSEKPSPANLMKFATVTILGSAISSAILKNAITMGFGYWIGIIAILLIVPLMTFIAHHVWTYQQPARM